MSTFGTGGRPDAGSEESWTNETLPMGIRKELLERELQNYMAGKRHGPSASTSHDCGHAADGSGHPVADSPGDDRAS